MSAWLEQLDANRRSDLVRLWLELGLVLLGSATDGNPTAPGPETITVPRTTEQQEKQLRGVPSKKRTKGSTGKASGRPARKLTPELKERLFRFFEEGMSSKQAFEQLKEPRGTVPISHGYVKWLKTEWSKAKAAQSVPEPT